MSERSEHRDRWDDELAAFALNALDDREGEAVELHLAECDECRERLHWLVPAVDVLPATVPQQAPPPELRARLLEVVEREAAEAEGFEAAGTGAEAPRPEPAAAPLRRRLRMPGLAGISLRPAFAGLAVVLLLAAGVVGYAVRDESGTDVRTYTAQGTGEGSLAQGTLEVDGDQGSLTVSGLPETRPGEVYQAWIQEDGHDGKTHPSSVFVVSDDGSGNVSIPHGLDGADRVMVTREPKGGSEKPGESSLLTAELG